MPQALAQLASQSVFTGLHNPAALDFNDSDDQQVVLPAQPDAELAPLITFVPPNESCFDSSSDDEMPLQDLQFVKGCAQHGDAVGFTGRRYEGTIPHSSTIFTRSLKPPKQCPAEQTIPMTIPSSSAGTITKS